MSLLLEALKKAELAKQGQAEAQPVDDGALRLEPVITREALPDISPALEITADDLPPASTAPATTDAPDISPDMIQPRASMRGTDDPTPDAPPGIDDTLPPEPEFTPGLSTGRDAARQLFDVKEVDYNPRRPFYITLGILGLSAAGYGAYLWWELQPKSLVNTKSVASSPKSAPEAAPQPPATSVPTAEAGSAAPADSATASASPTQPADKSAAPPAAPTQPAAASPVDKPAAAPAVPQAAPTVPRPAAATAAAPQTAAAAPSAMSGTPPDLAPTAPRAAPRPSAPRAPRGPIKISPPSIEPDELLDRAYSAYQRGDFNLARETYLQVLQREPGNRDALLGMAAIDLRNGELDMAEARYTRLLELDPRDTHARAGLIALRGASDPAQSESRLKSLIAQQPESGQLHFTLGNTLASQRRWTEAQEAYFRAFALEPENPDYAFNLAISLDQLRQPKPALEHYRKAIVLAGKRPSSFNPATALARIRELEK